MSTYESTNSNCDSVGIIENAGPITNRSTSLSANETNDARWLTLFVRADQMLSGSLLNLAYRIIDILILLFGLFSNQGSCSFKSHLAATSICLLIFYFIDLLIIGIFFLRNLSQSQGYLTEEEKTEQFRRVQALRGFFVFFKLIPVCFGLAYTFTSTIPQTNDCELLRFCLGIVCISTILIIIIPPTNPEIPPRRAFFTEIFIISLILIINGSYIGTVTLSMMNTNQSSCIYHNFEDLYLRAPLKSFAMAGIIVFGGVTGLHILHLLISQLCNRLTYGRRYYVNYFGLQYTLNYFSSLIVLYYLSVGALLLFQPRSGQPCRSEAPGLYGILLKWQWFRMLIPLVLIPLILVVCCLGVFVGIILSYCLPASITVPLLELLRSWLSAAPVRINPNPPATQENIDALPTVQFGQEPDRFNQTSCAICQTNYEANEPLRKLTCGHLFHSTCVANWLLITGICPVCRRRMTSVS